MRKILIVEDDKDLNPLIATYLRVSGYECNQAYDGIEGLDLFNKGSYDLILSDIMMPRMDGFALARKVREINEEIPFIFLSAKDDKLSKQVGYKIGIDDYITKPFDLDELILKITAILRRSVKVNEITIGNLKMNIDEHIATINNEEVYFSVREFNILYKLVTNPKKTFTRSALMDEFWDFDSSATSRTVDVYMAKIREKTQDCDGFEIQTIHGLGYKVILKWKVDLRHP